MKIRDWDEYGSAQCPNCSGWNTTTPLDYANYWKRDHSNEIWGKCLDCDTTLDHPEPISYRKDGTVVQVVKPKEPAGNLLAAACNKKELEEIEVAVGLLLENQVTGAYIARLQEDLKKALALIEARA